MIMEFTRYAIYYAPHDGPLAAFTAAWLGWDAARGLAVPHPDIAGLDVPGLTATPRKYGFHGTIKAPFHLADGMDAQGLHSAAAGLCARIAPVTLPTMHLHALGGFVAITPQGDAPALARLAADVVTGLDAFRAPPTPAELARRRPKTLTPGQQENLARWGYPYVMDDFRFHLTLTGDLPPDQVQAVQSALHPIIMPLVPQPFAIDSLCLFGQAQSGMFQILHRYALTG
jgi:putative phosphonate metabolism protein